MSPLLHIDTDFGGDPDDACALAMMLGWQDVEITGITTTLEDSGQRAGCVAHYLDLAGRTDIPVAAGADITLTGQRFSPTWGDERYWPDPITPNPSPHQGALDLLAGSIRRGATILAIGGFTNLALLELDQPGVLERTRLVAMAGWLAPPAEGLPSWGPAGDFNMQCDTRAAEVVLDSAHVTLVTLPVAMRAQLRDRDLGRLTASGPIGALLARQSATYAADAGMREQGRAHRGLADDLVNFHWDPVTAAVAVGWPGATVDNVLVETRLEDDVLVMRESDAGRAHRVTVDIDVESFSETWLASVENADRRAARGRG
jgi:inosine-uridine nucleoside N-ribohydrolase